MQHYNMFGYDNALFTRANQGYLQNLSVAVGQQDG